MVTQIGSRKPWSDGRWVEVHILTTDGLTAIVYGDRANINAKQSAGAFDFCEGTIHLDSADDLEHFNTGNGLQVWIGQDGDEPTLLTSTIIDYVEVIRDQPSEPFQVKLECRSPMSSLVDGGYRGEHRGKTRMVVKKISEPFDVTCDIDDEIACYINCASRYAALRLIAISMEASILVDPGGEMTFRRRTDLEREAEAEAHLTIDMSNASNIKMRQGVPLRRS